jgi:hypothetical protein
MLFFTFASCFEMLSRLSVSMLVGTVSLEANKEITIPPRKVRKFGIG